MTHLTSGVGAGDYKTGSDKAMGFYEFSQNNSGGSFDYDENSGISHFVIVEADSADDANARAERIGLYFDGYGDCECCGNRWYEQWDYQGSSDASEVPTIYGVDVSSGVYTPAGSFGMRWMKGYEGFIHYADGRVVGVDFASMGPGTD